MRAAGALSLVVLLISSCARKDERERLESFENRLQATEFHLATLSEVEPRLAGMIRTTEERSNEWAGRLESTRQTLAESETRLFSMEQRLEQTEEWIREKEKEEEKEKVYATPDGQVPVFWKQLNDKCALNQAGSAQTTLNTLVRIDRYMSEFPVQHPVVLQDEDPLKCVTSNQASQSAPLRQAFRAVEMSILKGRDQWLGYRIDRSWEVRPERGECITSCCKLDLAGAWTCDEGWEGGRWECEYDVEGWRDYTRRWNRKCDYLEGTRDFYSMPYLMQKMVEKQLPIPEELFCVVDLVWENRVYCLSHSHYPVMQIQLPDLADHVTSRPKLSRFAVIAVRNWDVLYKDEWTSTWIVRGVVEPEFPGQKSGFELRVVQEPACCPATAPEQVLTVIQALACVPEPKRAEALPALLQLSGFENEIDFETQRMGMERDPGQKVRLDAAGVCP